MIYRSKEGDSDSLVTTWKTSLDELSPDARRLFEMLSWLAPDPLPQTLFDQMEQSGTFTEPDAVPLMRRAISIYHHFATHNGHEHPHWNRALSHYRGMLQATGLSEPDVAAAIRDAMQD